MMKNDQLIRSLVFLIGTALVNHATADVYKCTSFDRQSNQQQIVYTDTPCEERDKQTLISVQTNPINAAEADDSTLDVKVARAVLKRDFQLAKSLATTKEHWRLISMAEGEPQTSVRTAPIVAAQTQLRDDCAIARDDFESTSRTRWRDKDLIATKKSMMFAACGVAETVEQPSVVVVGNPYGHVQSRRWVGTPYGPVIHHQPYQKHHSNHINSGGGLSIDYKSKHLGVRAQSGGIQKHTDIRQQFRTNSFAAEPHTDIRQQFR